jgi:hypothetical protein
MPHNPASIVRLLYDAHEAEHKTHGSDLLAKSGRRQFVAANDCRPSVCPDQVFRNWLMLSIVVLVVLERYCRPLHEETTHCPD